MKRVPHIVLVFILLAACSRPDEVVGLAPQLGSSTVLSIDLAIGANLYAATSERRVSSSADLLDPLRGFSNATVSRFSTGGDILWERDVLAYNHSVSPSDEHAPILSQSLVDTDSSGNAYSFTEISDFEYNGFCSDVLYSSELTKLSPAGEQLWSKDITGAVGGFAVDREGNTYLAGIKETCNEANGFRTKINFLRKYAPDGSLVWSRGLGGDPSSVALTVTPWGSAFVRSYSYVENGGSETQLSRYNVEGRLLWSKRVDYAEVFYSGDYAEILFSKDHLYMLNFENQSKLDKYDRKGNLVWSRTYADTKEFPKLTFNDLTVDPAGNVIMVGNYDASKEVAIRKVSFAGETLWTSTLYDPLSTYHSSYSVGNRDNGGSIYVGSNGGDDSQVSRLGRGGSGDWIIR